MNGSELLLPFVIAEQRRQADQAVLVRLALEARNSTSDRGGPVSEMVAAIRRQMRAILDRGQLGPVATTA